MRVTFCPKEDKQEPKHLYPMKRLPVLVAAAGLAALVGCQNANRYESNASSESVVVAGDEVAASISGVSADSAKFVKTGALQLQVANADSAIRDFSALAQSLGGMITHQNLEYPLSNSRRVALSADSVMLVTALSPQANITARIPAQNLENFLFRVTDNSLYPISRSLDIDDQSLLYLQNTLRSRNRTEVLAQNSGNKGFNKADRVNMGDEAIDQTIANRRIDADVRYSTVTLQLTQHPIIRKETIANTDISAYRTPAGKRFSMAMSEGGRLFADVFFGLLHLWAFILVGILVFFSIRYARRNFRKSRPFPAAGGA